jgi:hypothetical protein
VSVPGPRNSSSLYFCLGGVLGLAVVLLAGLSLRQSVGVRLADGTRLRVLGQARGSNPVLEYPAEYTRPPVAWIPRIWRERLHLHTWTLAAGIDPNPDAVFVWFVRYDGRVGETRSRLFSRVEVVDNSGRVLEEAAQTPLDSQAGKRGIILVPHPPADEAGFTLRLFGGEPAGWMEEIRVPVAPRKRLRKIEHLTVWNHTGQ